MLLAGFQLRPVLIAAKAQGAAGNAAPAPEPTPAPAPMPSVNPRSGLGLVRPGGSAWHGYVARVNSALIITPSLRAPRHRVGRHVAGRCRGRVAGTEAVAADPSAPSSLIFIEETLPDRGAARLSGLVASAISALSLATVPTGGPLYR